jgi:hypothetical protein
MQAAVRSFQKKNGIQVDGVIGFQTWAQLRGTPARPPSTDQRTPHTFVDTGKKARWFIDEEPAIRDASKDEVTLLLVSVGTEELDPQNDKAVVRITRPGKTTTLKKEVGPPVGKKGEGDLHNITFPNFTDTFPSQPPGAALADYFIEAYFEKELGGDFWKGKIVDG